MRREEMLPDSMFTRPLQFSMNTRRRAYNEIVLGPRPFSNITRNVQEEFLSEIAAYRSQLGNALVADPEDAVKGLRTLLEDFLHSYCSIAFSDSAGIRVHTHEAMETGDDAKIYREPRGALSVVGRVMAVGVPFLDNFLQGDKGRESATEKQTVAGYTEACAPLYNNRCALPPDPFTENRPPHGTQYGLLVAFNKRGPDNQPVQPAPMMPGGFTIRDLMMLDDAALYSGAVIHMWLEGRGYLSAR